MPQATVDDKTIFDHLVGSGGRMSTVAEGGQLEEGQKLAVSALNEPTSTATRRTRRSKPTRLWPMSKATRRRFGCRPRLPFRPETGSPMLSGSLRQRAGHHTVRRRRVWRQDRRPAGRRGRPTVEGGGATRAGCLEPGRGVLLRHLPAGGRREDQVGIAKEGKIVLWDYNVYFAGDRGARHISTTSRIIARTASAAGSAVDPARIHSPRAPGAPRRTIPTASPASPRSTSWRPKPRSIRSNSA